MTLRRSFAAAFVAFALCALAPAATALAATTGVTVVRGSNCHPTHFNGQTEQWAYVGHKLVNQGTSNWDVLVASCPLLLTPHTQAPSSTMSSIRVLVDGGTPSNAWCRLYDWQGVLRPMNTSNGWWHTWTAIPNTGVYPRDVTIECLLLGGWELRKIEVEWNW